MRVKFLRRVVYDTNGPGKGPVYEQGSEHDLSEDEANRWFRRNVAVEVTPTPAATPTQAAAPAPEPDPPQPGAPERDAGDASGKADAGAAPPVGRSIVHAGGGHYHVLGADGSRLTTKALPKAEAEAMRDAPAGA